jgi:hypothetical protein
MTLKEFTEWVQGIKLVKDLLTPAKKPRKSRKPTDDKQP